MDLELSLDNFPTWTMNMNKLDRMELDTQFMLSDRDRGDFLYIPK